MRYKRIHIIGSVGSGKTTLGRQLSSTLHIPVFELDNVVWERSPTGDMRRNDQERDAQLQEIVQKDTWILEGVHHTWVKPSFEKADLIIFLDTSYSKRTYRIITRYCRQKLGIENANYKPSFKIFKSMFSWNAHFEKKSKPEILQILEEFQDKVVIIKNASELRLKD
ncbi:DNA topology modulation protein FlaR [Anaerobacillus alkaliphilus]|uniref:DNA topology modulation protein FlaR n=1 Tax=Anaerobacillus alkaliphilus TaxID=1548597 RepID=A0A4Q0VZ78_9BACI|nr:AAA family ATPase [Anaerobacillus alkaliphilus]RXJ04358.1 DNA topology modulation protein FlaR [Anaerobacillus alkaliphilus]